jgi:hypothetical protein
MAKVNLSGMSVEALMDLRKRVDEMLLEHRAEIARPPTRPAESRPYSQASSDRRERGEWIERFMAEHDTL